LSYNQIDKYQKRERGEIQKFPEQNKLIYESKKEKGKFIPVTGRGGQ
jgi:hypothetical protein